MKKINIIILCVLLFSCNSSNEINQGESPPSFTRLSLKISSSTGIDLLNPSNIETYIEEKIKMFYLIDGDKKEVSNFSIVSPSDSGSTYYYIGLSLNAYYNSDAITYIEWNEFDTDTIRADYRFGENYKILHKAWFNEELIFNEEDESENIYEIIKD